MIHQHIGFVDTDISLCDFSQLEVCSDYLASNVTTVDVDGYAYAQTIEIIKDFTTPIGEIGKISSHSGAIMAIVKNDCSIISTSSTNSAMCFNYSIKNSYTNFNTILIGLINVGLVNSDYKIIEHFNESGNEKAIVSQSDTTFQTTASTNDSVQSASNGYTGYGSNGGAGGGDDANWFNNVVSKEHYLDYSNEILMRILEYLLYVNRESIPLPFMEHMFAVYQKNSVLGEQRQESIGFYRAARRFSRGPISREFIYINRVGNTNVQTIYVRRNNSSYFNLESRPNAIEQAQNVLVGLPYDHSETSVDSMSESSTLVTTMQQQLLLQQQLTMQQAIQQAMQQAAHQSPQQVQNTYINANQRTIEPVATTSIAQGNNLVNQILTFLSTTGLIFVIIGGVPYLISRNHRNSINRYNDNLRGLGIQRGAHDFSVMTRNRGLNIFGRNFFGVPYSPFIRQPSVSYEDQQNPAYLSGVREGREVALDEYSCIHPSANNRMRNGLNQNAVIGVLGHHNSQNTNPNNPNSSSGHPLIAFLISAIAAYLNTRNSNSNSGNNSK